MAGDILDVHWPLAGLSRRLGYQQAEPYTTYDCLNVRSQDVFQQRLRGGSRPGLVQVLPPKSTELTDPPGEDEPEAFGPTEFTPSKDCHANSDSGSNVNGANILTGLLAGRISRTFVHYDISATVPTTATITSAYLTSNTGTNSVATSWVLYIRKLLRTTWTETGCNWTQYDGSNNWTTAGGSGDGTDITTTSPAQVAFTVPGGTGAVPIVMTGLEAIVQDVISTGQVHLQLKKDNEAVAGRLFMNSSEAVAGTSLRLVLEWTVP